MCRAARVFYQYAGLLTEPALHQGLVVCGASDEEATRFARALLDRIRQLGEVCGHTASSRPLHPSPAIRDRDSVTLRISR